VLWHVFLTHGFGLHVGTIHMPSQITTDEF